jgi:signal transduction histidine kinase
MAEIQTNQGDYTGSESTCIEAFPYLGNKGKFLYGESNIYIILGNNYLNTAEYKNAIISFKKAINHKTDKIDRAKIENNIAIVLTASKHHQEALNIYNKLLLEKNILKDQIQYSMVLNNLGRCLYKVGNKKALTYYYKSLKIKKLYQDKIGIADTYYNLSEYYTTTDATKSYRYARLAYSLMTNADNKLEVLKLLVQNSKGNELKKNSTLYIKINDSIVAVRQKSKNTFAKIKYDSKQEKEENKRLKQQKVENLLQLEVQKYKTYGLYFVILIILILTIYTYYYLKRKNTKEKIQVSYLTELQIAKKLHDELANDLFQTMSFAETQDLSSAINKELLLENLDAIYSRTRNISKENSTIDTGIYYDTNLKNLISDFNTETVNIIVSGFDAIDWLKVEAVKKIVIYRVMQELLVNMKKHSQCNLVLLSFKKDNKSIYLNYSDNGIGSNDNESLAQYGLQNMTSRINSIAGKISLDTEIGKGYKVNIQIPI